MSPNPKKIISNGKIIGLIDVSFDEMFGKNTLEINNFEIFEKGNGNGSVFIDELIASSNEEKRDIYLYSYSKISELFWIANGFVITLDSTGTEVLKYSAKGMGVASTSKTKKR